MRVLVTGHTGFLGSEVVRELEALGHEVTGLSRSCDVGIACDLTDGDATAEALAGLEFGAVVHLAGIGSPTGCERDPARAFEANTRSVWNLLEALTGSGGLGHLTLGSSAAVYGVRSGVLDESLPPEPSTTYGASKAAAEVLAAQYGRWNEAPVALARLFNLTGPGMPGTTLPGEVATRIAAAEAAGEEAVAIEVRNPDHLRDFLDVRDAARAVALVLEGGLEGPVNVCSGGGTGVSEVIEVFRGLTEVGIEVAPPESGHERAEPDPAEVVGSRVRLTGETGWEPEVGLAASLQAGLDRFRQAEPD